MHNYVRLWKWNQCQSLPLYSCTYTFVTLSLDGGREICTTPSTTKTHKDISIMPSMVDMYMQWAKYQYNFPWIMTKHRWICINTHTVWNNDPMKSLWELSQYTALIQTEKKENYGLCCKYQLLKLKPWHTYPQDACSYQPESNDVFISNYQEFLTTDYAKSHVTTIAKELQRAQQYSNIVSLMPQLDQLQENTIQHYNTLEWEWNHWHNSVTEEQLKAYNIVSAHYTQFLSGDHQDVLHMLILGTAETGKSSISCSAAWQTLSANSNYRNCRFQHWRHALHSALQLPIQGHNKKWPPRTHTCIASTRIQRKAKLDSWWSFYAWTEHDGLGWQKTATGNSTFKSTMHLVAYQWSSLVHDFAQLPPVGDWPLFAPEGASSHGYTMYQLFTKVVILPGGEWINLLLTIIIIIDLILYNLWMQGSRAADMSHIEGEQPLEDASKVILMSDFSAHTRGGAPTQSQSGRASMKTTISRNYPPLLLNQLYVAQGRAVSSMSTLIRTRKRLAGLSAQLAVLVVSVGRWPPTPVAMMKGLKILRYVNPLSMKCTSHHMGKMMCTRGHVKLSPTLIICIASSKLV